MGADIDRLVNEAAYSRALSHQSKPGKHPEGWEPGVRLEGSTGTITTSPSSDRDPRWDQVLEHFGFDPEEFEVMEPINVRTWEGFAKNPAGEIEKVQLWYHRANIIRRRGEGARADCDALIREIKRARPRKRPAPDGERALVINFADLQIGKPGTELTVSRALDAIDGAKTRLRELRRSGRTVGAIYLANLGDALENTNGQYKMQPYQVELNAREQERVARRLFVAAVKSLAPLVQRVVVVAVPGNHPENRDNGKAHTTFGDNADLGVVEQVAEVFAENPDAYGHVSFVLAEPDTGGELSVTLDVAGVVCTWAHGHQFSGKDGAWKWWDGQGRGFKPARDARLLFCGHKHVLSIDSQGPRTVMQCPTLEERSEWYEHKHGCRAAPGVLSVLVGPDGWSDLALL